MSRGIIEAQTLRSEQFEFEARTSDPADAQPGEYWIRTDQTSSNPDVIAELRRQDTSGVTTCPIFAASEESNLGTDVTRGPSVVLDDGSVGFVAMTTKGGAVGSPRAVNAAGTEYVSHDGLEFDPIPDSVIQQNFITNQSYNDGDIVDPFVADVGSPNLTANTDSNSDPTFDVDGLNSGPAVVLDGDEDGYDYNTSTRSEPLTFIFALEITSTVSIGALWVENANNRLLYESADDEWALVVSGNLNRYSPISLGDKIVTLLVDGTDAKLRVNGADLMTVNSSSGVTLMDSGSFFYDSANSGRAIPSNVGGVAIHDKRLSGTALTNEEQRVQDEFGMNVL